MPRTAWRRRLFSAVLALPLALAPLAACSSFSAATADAPDSGAPDSTPADTATLDARMTGEADAADAGPGMTVMVYTFDEPGSCTPIWRAVGGATMEWIPNGVTSTGGACEVCCTPGAGTPFVELTLPTMIGSYTINAFVHAPQVDASTAVGRPAVGFQVTSTLHDGVGQPGNGASPAPLPSDGSWGGGDDQTELTTLTAIDDSPIIIRAVLEVDDVASGQTGCFDVDTIDIVFGPPGH